MPLEWQFEAAFSLGGKETNEESFYRLDSDYGPVRGLPKEFWQHPLGHKCYAAYEGVKDHGFDPMIPVTLKPVSAAELTGRKKVYRGKGEGEEE